MTAATLWELWELVLFWCRTRVVLNRERDKNDEAEEIGVHARSMILSDEQIAERQVFVKWHKDRSIVARSGLPNFSTLPIKYCDLFLGVRGSLGSK